MCHVQPGMQRRVLRNKYTHYLSCHETLPAAVFRSKDQPNCIVKDAHINADLSSASSSSSTSQCTKSDSIVNMHSLTTEQSIRLLECIGVKGIRYAIIASGREFDVCGIDTEEDLKDFLSEVKLEVSKLRLKALFKKFKRYQDGEEAIPESVLSAKDSVATASS